MHLGSNLPRHNFLSPTLHTLPLLMACLPPLCYDLHLVGQLSRIDKLSNLHIATSNIRSIHNKSAYISKLISDNHLDLLSVTETWHSYSDDLLIYRSALPNYSIIDLPHDAASAGLVW